MTRPRRGLGVAFAVGAAAVLAAAPAQGKILRFGSKLDARAGAAKAHRADTVYWHDGRGGGVRPKAPAAGQVLSVKIKGRALSDRKAGEIGGGGETLFHLQTLEPIGGGRMRVKVTSQDLYLPDRSAPSQVVTTYRPVNMCVSRGDSVGFNHIGGWDGRPDRSGPYPDGTPLRIFARTPRARFRWFEGDNATGNGAVFSGRSTRRRELRMRVRLGTGRDASVVCPGGKKPYSPAAATARRFTRGVPVPAVGR